MKSSSIIIINTLATYGRTLFAMALGIFSGRWVYQSLGPIDYGLMAVVGGLISFVMFLTGVTTSSCTRFFALSVGRGDLDETNHWFNTSLSIHCIVPFILIAIGWPIAEWAIAMFLNVPVDRLATARWVFRFSLIAAFWGMISTPYMAMFMAHQRIYEMSIISIVQTLLNFVFVYFLTYYTGDAWLVYAAGTVAITIFVGVIQVLRARAIFPECRIHWDRWFQKPRLRQVFSFAGWQLFGGLGSLLRENGIAILLNKYFNPTLYPSVNASYSIAGMISGYTQTFASALLGAFTPAITSTEGKGDRQRMLKLANQASKFGTWLIMLFAVPVMLEIDNLLTLWLKKPPEMAGLFCWLILAQFLIERISFGHMVAVNAVGRIAVYQMILGTCFILTLPLAFLFLWFGAPPIAVCYAIVITSSLCSAGRIWLARSLVGASAKVWAIDVLRPIVLVLVCSFGAGYMGRLLWGWLDFPVGFLRICFTTAMTFLGTLVLAWFIVLNPAERGMVQETIRGRLSKA